MTALALHAAMLPQGQWHDEYFTFSFLRALGWRGTWIRVANWGPRPVSELLIFGYWRAVQAWGGPLMAPVLAFAWALLFAFLGAALRPWRASGRLARLALWLTLPASFLMAGPVGELWYWPLGALAYLPALGAAGFAVLALAGPGVQTRAAWGALAAALAVGAWSVELGCFFALLLCPLLMAEAAFDRRWRRAAVMGMPLAAAVLVLAALLHGRAADSNEMVAAGTFHRAWPSLRAALPPVAAGMAGLGGGAWHAIGGVAGRVLLGLGCWAVFSGVWPQRTGRRRLAMVLAALAGTAVLSEAGAYYQFGILCCERHEAFRQALYLLMVVAGAGLLPRPRVGVPAARVSPAARLSLAARVSLAARLSLAAPALLAASVLVAAVGRVPDLMAEYRLAGVQRAARAALFASGRGPGNTLQMVLADPGPLLEGSHFGPGIYTMVPAPAWYVQGPMMFFGKTKMVVRDGAQ